MRQFVWVFASLMLGCTEPPEPYEVVHEQILTVQQVDCPDLGEPN